MLVARLDFLSVKEVLLLWGDCDGIVTDRKRLFCKEEIVMDSFSPILRGTNDRFHQKRLSKEYTAIHTNETINDPFSLFFLAKKNPNYRSIKGFLS